MLLFLLYRREQTEALKGWERHSESRSSILQGVELRISTHTPDPKAHSTNHFPVRPPSKLG